MTAEGGQNAAAPMHLAGSVVAVASNPTHGFSKPTRDSIYLIEGHGVEGDVHGGLSVRDRYLARKRPHLPNLRQVHLLPAELFSDLEAAGYDIRPGDLGENITTKGLDLTRLPAGTLIRMGDSAAVELTGLRTPCALIDRFRKGFKKRMVRPLDGGPKFNCGVLGIVRMGGLVAPADAALAELPCGPRLPLPPL
jgi:MOSC domain-containing protein YiiM